MRTAGTDEDQTVDAARVLAGGVHPPSPTAAAAALGRKLRFSLGELLSNRFIIIRFLGSGGMGEVYEAQDRLLQGASIALKTITPHLASSRAALERFEREVLLARQITHPNVCPIYDICYHEDDRGVCCFLSMKLIHGETLAARLDRQGPIPSAQAISIVVQIASALHAAHTAGIIHRDIKPSNIMLEGGDINLKAVVMDFGLARAHDSDITVVSAPHVLGTPGYMAPELLKGQPANKASDLYAFGLVLQQIFGGEKPRPGEPFRLAPALRAPRVPSFFSSLTAHCLADDPRTRSVAFADALKRLNIDRGSGISRLDQPFWTRRRWLITAASAGGVVGGTAVFERDDIAALMHPLPRTKHVALVNWPPQSELRFAPTLLGIIDALERELTRAEAFDHDLYVVSALSMAKDEVAVPGSLNANLMLATSVIFQAKAVRLTLEILDTAATRLFRRKTLRCAPDEISTLPEMAVHAAAELLGVSQYVQPGNRLKVGTDSPQAYRAFQSAEGLRHQPNDQALEAAIEQYKIAVEQDNRYALALAMLAAAYYRLYWVRHDAAALDLAQANATTALGIDPMLAQAHQVLGAIWAARGNTQAAIDELGEALKLDPSNPQTLIHNAVLLADLEQYPRAEELFQRVLKARPNYWLTYNDFGNFLRLQGRYVEALRSFRAGHLANPQNTYVLSNLGQLALKSGLLKESRQSLEASLALRPSAVASASLAQELRVEGKYTEALNYAQKAVALDADDDENWRELGDCYNALPGHRAQAQQAFSKAAEKAASSLQTNSSDGVRWMLLALYQAKLKQVDAAFNSLRKAEAYRSGDLDSQLTKIRVLELLGKRQEALATAAACVRKGATKFEIDFLPDLQSLRADSRYLTVVHSK